MSLKQCISCSCALLMAGLLSVAPSSARYSTNAQSGCQPVNCPPCRNNQPPLDGSGPAQDGSGRRTLIVHIDNTWGDPTNTNIWNAVTGAISDWNIAVDTTCTPPTQKTGYFLKLDQNAAVGLRDIQITSNDNIPKCAETKMDLNPRNRPDTIKLKSAIANLDPPWKIRKIIAHETGDEQTCDFPNSLEVFVVTSANVGQSNRQINPSSRPTCTVTAQPSSTGLPSRRMSARLKVCSGTPLLRPANYQEAVVVAMVAADAYPRYATIVVPKLSIGILHSVAVLV